MPAMGLSEIGGIGTVPTPYIALGGIMCMPGGAITGGAIPGGAIPGAIPGGSIMPAGAIPGAMPGGRTLSIIIGAPGAAPYSCSGLPGIISTGTGDFATAGAP
jgi:Ca-activated chloride channel homolog